MNILSLFGGAEQGRAVLKEMGIIPTNYFSSEIDPYVIKLSSDNFPDIVHIGSVTDVGYHDGWLTHAFSNDGMKDYGSLPVEIDFLIGGPPCQDLSIAGKRAGLDGAHSSLFYKYVRILNETKRKIFFMENVPVLRVFQNHTHLILFPLERIQGSRKQLGMKGNKTYLEVSFIYNIIKY